MALTFDQLRDATADWRAVSVREAELRAERDSLILQALSEGMSQREVARAVGVSHGLPAQIVAKHSDGC